MPYIKCISIGNSVASCLKYIANPDKIGENLYITGLNCSEDIAVAEQEFRLTYEYYSHRNFYAPISENGKSPVKAFHIILVLSISLDTIFSKSLSLLNLDQYPRSEAEWILVQGAPARP